MREARTSARLLRIRSRVPIASSSVASSASGSSSSSSRCSLCQRAARYQSTSTNPHVALSKSTARKAKKARKKYTDTVVVNETHAAQVKAHIRKLHPAQLKHFALTTDLTLGEIHKADGFTREHAYSNLVDIGIASEVPQQQQEHQHQPSPLLPTLLPPPPAQPLPAEISEDADEEMLLAAMESGAGDELLFGQRAHATPFQPEVVEETTIVESSVEPSPPMAVSGSRRDRDFTGRQVVIGRTIAAYVEVCAAKGLPNRGLNAFLFFKLRNRYGKTGANRYPTVTDVNVYNALLKGFGRVGDFRRLQEVLQAAKERHVELNAQSFAAIFECLGRVNFDDSHTRFVRFHAKDAAARGITFDDIMNDAVYLHDSREKVLLAMRAHEFRYQPQWRAPQVQYRNELLNPLNHDDQLTWGAKPTVEVDCPVRNQLLDGMRRQLDAEKRVMVQVRNIEAEASPSPEVLHYRAVWQEHMRLWEVAAAEAFQRDLMAQTAQRSTLNHDLYLRSIPARDIVAIIIDEAVRMAQGSETYSPTTTQLYRDLGSRVYARFRLLQKQKTGVLTKMERVHARYLADYASEHAAPADELPPTARLNVNARQQWQWAEHACVSDGATIAMDHQEWTPAALITIGRFLYNIITHDLKIEVNALRPSSKHKNYLPAFYSIFRTVGRATKEEVKPHPVLAKLYRASQPEQLAFPVYELPMYCPPVPWTSVANGGYLVAPCDVVRLPSQAQTQKARMKHADPATLYPTFDSLNQLAAVPWRVNERILDLVVQVFRAGGSAKLNIPELPESLPAPAGAPSGASKAEKHAAFRQRMQYRRRKGEMHSLRCDCLYRICLANHFRDDVFWLPHNMDFRGRVYPIPPHLNHLGSDLARSMLVFAESRPLGADGLNWLKLHLVNLTGLKKRDPIDERLAFAESILPEVLDSADAPLTGRRWWTESEEPWQTLACCMEIAAAVRAPDGPAAYRTRFPVHQDGSCNGLQHYAALGRDGAGAFSVNLMPARRPQDVYSAVVALVEERRAKDAAAGVEIARVLDGFVKRKVIKQTVMTTVYGVTRFGARLQIARQLKDLDAFPKEAVWAASSYLTARTFDSLRTMFTSTKEIQDWFTECARLISAVCGENVEWVTPLGLPVVQPYIRYRKPTAIAGCENSGSANSFQIDSYERPNVMKQKNAFPPNFIHSLDSSHMMLTSLYCERAGITFVSVHDCFWTHPSTVHIMNKTCRDQFVALHAQPILEELSCFLTQRFSYHADDILNDGSVVELTKRKLNRLLRKLPKTGDFDINDVKESVYFFS